ncbi:uncharacterized protein K02A2.6 [Trichonephila clavipes]|nr:uncharacterized protein K02A2.6 [Trichonephila clavipes]
MYGLNGAPAIWQRYVDGLFQASDASPVGIGCVLSHVYPDGSERPIAFASRTLSGSEKNTPKLIRRSSFNSLGKVYQCWQLPDFLHYALILRSFEFDIIFRKTIEHGNADFLSRLPKTSEELEVKDDITIFQMSQIEALPVTSKELRQETSKDIELGPLLRALREGKDLQGREAQYTIEDGCIMYGQRVCIPRKFRKNVLEELHAGHLGIVKMKAIARSFVYWKNIDNDIEEAAKNCVDCARYKADPQNLKFITGNIPDGVLHYIIDVQGTLVRRHVDQIRPVGDKVQENIIPLMHQRFPSSEVRENNSNIQHAETAEDISKDRNKELGSSSVQGVPSTDVAVPDLSQSSAKETDSETRSPPVPDRPFPRRSGRIRRPPERLVL